jgi:hypothetical protein
MVKIEQVPTWIVERGIGHACASRADYSTTLCGKWGNFRHFRCTRPDRICAECRRRLRTATLEERHP